MASTGANTPLYAILKRMKVRPVRSTLARSAPQGSRRSSNTKAHLVSYLLD
jgi:hypothetical protein